MKTIKILLCLLLLLPFICCTVQAEEEQNAKDLLQELWDDLPDAAKDALDETPSEETVKEKVGFTYLFSSFIHIAKGEWQQNGGVLFRLLGLSLLFSAVAVFGGRSPLTEGALTVVLALALYGTLWDSMSRMDVFFSDLSHTALAFSPVLAGVFAMGGSTATAGAASAGFTAFLAILQTLCLGVLMPLLRVLFAFSPVSSIGTVPALQEGEKTVKSVYLFLLGLICMLLLASLAFQTSLASSADSVALRTVKFAIGNAVPVVGNTVSSTLGALTASLSLVKSTVGGTAVVVLLGIFLPLLAELLLRRLALSWAGALGAMVGAKQTADVFARFRSLYDLMIAACCMVSVLFLLLVGILAKCALPSVV